MQVRVTGWPSGAGSCGYSLTGLVRANKFTCLAMPRVPFTTHESSLLIILLDPSFSRSFSMRTFVEDPRGTSCPWREIGNNQVFTGPLHPPEDERREGRRRFP